MIIVGIKKMETWGPNQDLKLEKRVLLNVKRAKLEIKKIDLEVLYILNI